MDLNCLLITYPIITASRRGWFLLILLPTYAKLRGVPRLMWRGFLPYQALHLAGRIEDWLLLLLSLLLLLRLLLFLLLLLQRPAMMTIMFIFVKSQTCISAIYRR